MLNETLTKTRGFKNSKNDTSFQYNSIKAFAFISLLPQEHAVTPRLTFFMLRVWKHAYTCNLNICWSSSLTTQCEQNCLSHRIYFTNTNAPAHPWTTSLAAFLHFFHKTHTPSKPSVGGLLHIWSWDQLPFYLKTIQQSRVFQSSIQLGMAFSWNCDKVNLANLVKVIFPKHVSETVVKLELI